MVPSVARESTQAGRRCREGALRGSTWPRRRTSRRLRRPPSAVPTGTPSEEPRAAGCVPRVDAAGFQVRAFRRAGRVVWGKPSSTGAGVCPGGGGGVGGSPDHWGSATCWLLLYVVPIGLVLAGHGCVPFPDISNAKRQRYLDGPDDQRADSSPPLKTLERYHS